jgi:predicted kinase
LIRGVPGAGKSTFAEQLRRAGLITQFLEADKYFIDSEGKYIFDPVKLSEAHDWCQTRAKMYLFAGDSVAVSNTSTTEKEVAVYQRLAELTGANFVSIIIENRNNTESIHNVPAEKIQQMKDRFSVKL